MLLERAKEAGREHEHTERWIQTIQLFVETRAGWFGFMERDVREPSRLHQQPTQCVC
jgi:hypothetical protein